MNERNIGVSLGSSVEQGLENKSLTSTPKSGALVTLGNIGDVNLDIGDVTKRKEPADPEVTRPRGGSRFDPLALLDNSVNGEEDGEAGDEGNEDDVGGDESGEREGQGGVLNKKEGAGIYLDPAVVAHRLMEVDDEMGRLNAKTTELTTTVHGLKDSLEFSQREVDLLKKENLALKAQVGSLELEDKRAQFQIETVDDKLDRLETLVKKKNLLIEGVPELVGKKEDVEETIGRILDQLNVPGRINFDACYRLGQYSRSGSRPILVAFEKQSDRDMIYAKRMDLKHTADYQRVWLNEDLGSASKRKRGLIRLISKEAQIQGIDCRTGKYAIHIDKVKYDESNWSELPPPLQPTSLKQVQVDGSTIAYQSEFAPFSNFYPCQIEIGKHMFFCLEQAFQFLRAKFLNKHLQATRIYLSRDVRFIKQVGGDLGSSEDWEAQQIEVMYSCLKKKFEQNPALLNLLLATGNMELVEATQDRLWGCGATLSSNVLRRHQWVGQNRHGKILMTIRDEFRHKKEAAAK